jgi:GABA permease
MMFAMAQNGDAPRVFLKVNKKGVPVYAILGCTVVSYISVIFNYLSPDKIFLFLVNASGGVALLVYLVIAFSQLRLRKRYEKENPAALKIKMWFFPYLTYATILIITAIFIMMAFIDSLRSQFYLTTLIAVCVVGSFFAIRNKRSTNLLKDKKKQTV